MRRIILGAIGALGRGVRNGIIGVVALVTVGAIIVSAD
jgi:hypothetical protein